MDIISKQNTGYDYGTDIHHNSNAHRNVYIIALADDTCTRMETAAAWRWTRTYPAHPSSADSRIHKLRADKKGMDQKWYAHFS